jgi:hypothetical protein
MRLGEGGKKLLNAGLGADIDVCAALNSMHVFGVVDAATLTIKAAAGLPVGG